MNHDTSFGLGYILIEADFRYMAQLCKERVMARLSRTLFDYPIRPYMMCLTDYFVRASSSPSRSKGMIVGLNSDQEAELRLLVQ